MAESTEVETPRTSLHFYPGDREVLVRRYAPRVRPDDMHFQVPESGRLAIEVRAADEALIVWAFTPPSEPRKFGSRTHHSFADSSERTLLSVGPWAPAVHVPEWEMKFAFAQRGARLVIEAPIGVRVRSMSEPGFHRQPLVPTIFSTLLEHLCQLQDEHLAGEEDALDSGELQLVGERLAFDLSHNLLPPVQTERFRAAFGFGPAAVIPPLAKK